jgi:hypothetical protein
MRHVGEIFKIVMVVTALNWGSRGGVGEIGTTAVLLVGAGGCSGSAHFEMIHVNRSLTSKATTWMSPTLTSSSVDCSQSTVVT